MNLILENSPQNSPQFAPALISQILRCFAHLEMHREAVEFAKQHRDTFTDKDISDFFFCLRGSDYILEGINIFLPVIVSTSDIITCNNAIILCETASFKQSQDPQYLQLAMDIYNVLKAKMGMVVPLPTYHSLIILAGKSGNVEILEELYEDAVSRGFGESIHLLGAYLTGNNSLGQYRETIHIYLHKIDKYNIKPNSRTMQALLDACCNDEEMLVLGMKILLQWKYLDKGEVDQYIVDRLLRILHLPKSLSILSAYPQSNEEDSSNSATGDDNSSNSATGDDDIDKGKPTKKKFSKFGIMGSHQRIKFHSITKEELEMSNNNPALYASLLWSIENMLFDMFDEKYASKLPSPELLSRYAPLLAARKELTDAHIAHLASFKRVDRRVFSRICSRYMILYDWNEMILFLEKIFKINSISSRIKVNILGKTISTLLNLSLMEKASSLLLHYIYHTTIFSRNIDDEIMLFGHRRVKYSSKPLDEEMIDVFIDSLGAYKALKTSENSKDSGSTSESLVHSKLLQSLIGYKPLDTSSSETNMLHSYFDDFIKAYLGRITLDRNDFDSVVDMLNNQTASSPESYVTEAIRRHLIGSIKGNGDDAYTTK